MTKIRLKLAGILSVLATALILLAGMLFSMPVLSASAKNYEKVDKEGKKVIENFVYSGYASDSYTLVDSTEIPSAYMIALNMPSSGYIEFLPFANIEYTDWSDAKYMMFYVDNHAETQSLVGFVVESGHGGKYVMKEGATAYLDDGQTTTATTVVAGGVATGTCVVVDAGFKGYVKIAIDSTTLTGYADTVADMGTEISVVHFATTRGSKNTVYISSIALSYEEDIMQVFDGEFTNRANAYADLDADAVVNVIPDFYKRNKFSDWWDGENGVGRYLTGNGVTYAEDNRWMRMEYAGATDKTMWGNENLADVYHDWSDAKFMVIEMTNNGTGEGLIGYIFSEEFSPAINNSEHWSLGENYTYYLRDKKGTITSALSFKDKYVSLPVGFDGHVIIPIGSISLNEYPENYKLDLDKMVRMSFIILGGGDLTFGRVGYTASDSIINTEADIAYNDASEYSTYELEVEDGRENHVVKVADWPNTLTAENLQDQLSNGAKATMTADGDKLRIQYDPATSNDASTVWMQRFSADRNWSDARCLMIDIKNNSNVATNIGFYLSEGNSTKTEHFVINNGAIVFFRDREKDGACQKFVPYSQTYVTIPAGFDGYMVVPLDSLCFQVAKWCTDGDGVLNLASMHSLNFIFSEKTVADFTFGGVYYANSNKITDTQYPIVEVSEPQPVETPFVISVTEKVYDGEPVVYTVEKKVDVEYVVSFYEAESGEKLDQAPVQVGSYRIEVTATVEGEAVKVEKRYSIYRATPTFVLKTITETLYAGDSLPALLESGAGTLAFEDQALRSGTHSYAYIFTPTDTKNYTTVRAFVELTAIERSNPTDSTENAESTEGTEESRESGCGASLSMMGIPLITVFLCGGIYLTRRKEK